jgi:IclR family KDG regulon transcriptional repressor
MDAISKAFKILGLFLDTENDLSLTDVAGSVRISSSTAHRIISILVKAGYLEQRKTRGKYSLSTRMLVDFAGIIRKRLHVRTVALPYLNELSHATDEAVIMAQRFGEIAFNVELVNRNRILNLRADSNSYNLYSTGVGKVFLAYMPPVELKSYLKKVELKPRTPYTITDPDKLRKELGKIRRNGVAFDDQQHELGTRMAAAPVMDWEGNVAASVGVLGYSRRISKKRLADLGTIVKDYTFRISRAMGYDGNTD